MKPPQSRAGEISPLQISRAWAALYQLRAMDRMLKARATAPISLTQAGAFQAAKSRPTRRTVRMDMLTGPPSTKSVGREVSGIRKEKSVMVPDFLSLFP